MLKKIVLAFMLTFIVGVHLIPATTTYADNKFDSEITDKTKVYNSQDEGVKKLNKPFIKLVQTVGGIGGSIFVLVLLVISTFIFIGSLTPRWRSFAWGAFGSCCMGGFLFFGVAVFAEAIAGLAV